MKLSFEMVEMEIGDEHVAVPVEETNGFRGIVRMNQTAFEIWKQIVQGKDEESIAKQLVMKYDGIDLEVAHRSVQRVIKVLKDEGIIESHEKTDD